MNELLIPLILVVCLCKETADHYEVQVAAPGMAKSDFTVELEDNSLNIRSEKQFENELTRNSGIR